MKFRITYSTENDELRFKYIPYVFNREVNCIAPHEY